MWQSGESPPELQAVAHAVTARAVISLSKPLLGGILSCCSPILALTTDALNPCSLGWMGPAAGRGLFPAAPHRHGWHAGCSSPLWSSLTITGREVSGLHPPPLPLISDALDSRQIASKCPQEAFYFLFFFFFLFFLRPPEASFFMNKA